MKVWGKCIKADEGVHIPHFL